jgi:KDO2-lipid IV(A) lauroyltransferase
MKIKFLPFYIISLLPMVVLYLLADLLFVLAFYLFRYRRTVVRGNLSRAFPDLSDEERKILEKNFYQHFCDLMVEILKGFSISENEIKKRIRIKNLDLIEAYYQKNRNIILYAAHHGNWEWLTFISLFVPYKTITLYQPLSNNYFNELMKCIRERPGTLCVESEKGYKTILQHIQQGQLTFSALIGDQSPPKASSPYWVNFLNQETAFLTGAARIIEKTNQDVIFPEFKKIKRGKYEIKFKVLKKRAQNNGSLACIDDYANQLENTIFTYPEMWLWSHRRWKLSRSSA